MDILDEKKVLDHYVSLIDGSRISFLASDAVRSNAIRAAVLRLRDSADMHAKIGAAKVLWKLLFEAAMGYIDPDKRGYDDLFAYFDAYVDFEELIFASDSFYRDHTLHCLWVYFLGQWMDKRDEFAPIMDAFRTDRESMKVIPEFIDALAGGQSEAVRLAYEPLRSYYSFLETLGRMEDSQVCVAALVHDLGSRQFWTSQEYSR